MQVQDKADADCCLRQNCTLHRKMGPALFEYAWSEFPLLISYPSAMLICLLNPYSKELYLVLVFRIKEEAPVACTRIYKCQIVACSLNPVAFQIVDTPPLQHVTHLCWRSCQTSKKSGEGFSSSSTSQLFSHWLDDYHVMFLFQIPATKHRKHPFSFRGMGQTFRKHPPFVWYKRKRTVLTSMFILERVARRQHNEKEHWFTDWERPSSTTKKKGEKLKLSSMLTSCTLLSRLTSRWSEQG